MGWSVSDVCYVEQGLFEAVVLGTLANEVWAICETSAVRIGARRAGELGWERERESCGNEGGRRWVGGERCRTKRVRSGERLTREVDALKDVTWSGSAHGQTPRDMRRLSSENQKLAVRLAPLVSEAATCHHTLIFFSLHSEFVIYTCRYLWASWLRL